MSAFAAKWSLAIVMGLLPELAIAACFAPLSFSDPLSRDVNNWRDLESHAPLDSAKQQGVVRFLRLEDQTDPATNLDYYEVRFKKHPTKSPSQVFKELRLKFGDFATGYIPTLPAGFKPYSANSNDPKDSVRKINADRWASDDPSNAVMSFVLSGRYTITTQKDGSRSVSYKAGDVQATCSTGLDFIFSTVETNIGGTHPVAGNRGFGLRDNNDGTWSFYSKAVDRKSDFPSGIARLLFLGGDFFWNYFYYEMVDYLNSQGMTVAGPVIKNRAAPVTYPF